VRQGELLRPFTHEQHVIGLFHHKPRYRRNILDLANAGNRTGTARGAVHHARIEFDHALFVGQTAQPDAVIGRIVLLNLEHKADGVQGIATSLQQCVATVGTILTIRRRNEHGALGANRLRGRPRSFGRRRLLLGFRVNGQRRRGQRDPGDELSAIHALLSL
jgi:hypothetical protein